MPKVAIVAGNAPSIKEIDYSLMPTNYDVFRCNQFYMEDQYYLGKTIKAVCFASQTTFEHIYTMLHLKNKQEYDIHSIFLRDLFYPEKNTEQKAMGNLHTYFNNHHFLHKIYDGKYSHNINAFLEYTRIQELYCFKHITSGVMLCAIATAMGYKEIYLAGIDFYEGKVYAFDSFGPNLISIMPDFATIPQSYQADSMSWHSKEADLEALEFLRTHYGVKFYSLCPNSPASAYFPLPCSNQSFKTVHPIFLPQEKPSDYTCDLLIPPPHAYAKFRKPPKPTPQSKIKNFFCRFKSCKHPK